MKLTDKPDAHQQLVPNMKPGNALAERVGNNVPANCIHQWIFEIDDNDVQFFALTDHQKAQLARLRQEVMAGDDKHPIAVRLLELAFHAKLIEDARGPGTVLLPQPAKRQAFPIPPGGRAPRVVMIGNPDNGPTLIGDWREDEE